MKRLLSAALFAAFALVASVGFSVAPASAQVYQNGGAVLPETLCSAVTAGYPTGCAPTVGDKPFACAVTTALTQCIAATTGAAVHIPFIQWAGIESATGGFLEAETGTGTNCGTGTQILAVLGFIGTSASSGSYGNGYGQVYIGPAGAAVCFIALAGTVTTLEVAGSQATY